jgi:nucleoside-diphosphate-sugar epimerase
MLRDRYRVYGLTGRREEAGQLRALGIIPVFGDLDKRLTLSRLAGLAEGILHTAPPPAAGHSDSRTRNLISALGRGRMVSQPYRPYPPGASGLFEHWAGSRSHPAHHGQRRLVYISTSGVYGDCAGDWVPETRPLRPRSERAMRRVDAERRLRRWGRSSLARVSLLRTPGIYAQDRLPVERLRAGTPVLCAEDDVYTNHVHADDLARIAIAALRHGRTRSYNASDDTQLKMGEYFDLLADHLGLARPPRVSRNQAGERVPAAMLSFMEESRRLTNRRLRELRIRLGYPTVESALTASGRGAGATDSVP